MSEPQPERTDNSPRAEDGTQDLPQDRVAYQGDADDAYDPDRDGIQ